MSECGCRGDDVAQHGWFHCTPESRRMLAEERVLLAEAEARFYGAEGIEKQQ